MSVIGQQGGNGGPFINSKRPPPTPWSLVSRCTLDAHGAQPWPGRAELGRAGPGRGSDLSKMVTFMNMVITGVENGSPDMIPVAFDKKFDEKKR